MSIKKVKYDPKLPDLTRHFDEEHLRKELAKKKAKK